MDDKLARLAIEYVFVIDLLLTDQEDSVGAKQEHTDPRENMEHLKRDLSQSRHSSHYPMIGIFVPLTLKISVTTDRWQDRLIRYKLDTRLEKVDQREGPDQEAQKLGEEEQDEAGEIEHEGQLDEHGHGERQAEDEDLHAVPLEHAKAAPLVDLGVHEEVQ